MFSSATPNTTSEQQFDLNRRESEDLYTTTHKTKGTADPPAHTMPTLSKQVTPRGNTAGIDLSEAEEEPKGRQAAQAGNDMSTKY